MCSNVNALTCPFLANMSCLCSSQYVCVQKLFAHGGWQSHEGDMRLVSPLISQFSPISGSHFSLLDHLFHLPEVVSGLPLGQNSEVHLPELATWRSFSQVMIVEVLPAVFPSAKVRQSVRSRVDTVTTSHFWTTRWCTGQCTFILTTILQGRVACQSHSVALVRPLMGKW